MAQPIAKTNILIIAVAIVVVLLAAAVFLIPAISDNPSNSNTELLKSKSYVIMYIVGSDLESNNGKATNDLTNLAENFDMNNGDALVIYGGSDKDGWRDGATITNLTLIKEDLYDDIIGNDECYIFRIDSDIASTETVAESLKYATEYAIEHNLYDSAGHYLTFWGHGLQDGTFGFNDFSNNPLEINEVATALSQSGLKYDILTFDSCLLGSAEVGYAVHPYADYLLASEELHYGLNLKDVSEALSSGKSITVGEYAKKMIDSYIFNDKSATSRTLSLVNLNTDKGKSSQDLIDAMNRLGNELYRVSDNKYFPYIIGDAYTNSQTFGVPDDSLHSVDLYDFAERIYQNARDEGVKSAAKNVMDTLNSYVIASGHTAGDYTKAKGVSTIIPEVGYLTNMPEHAKLGSGGWYNFQIKYLTTLNSLGLADYYSTYHSGSFGIDREGNLIKTTEYYLYSANNPQNVYTIVGEILAKTDYVDVGDSVFLNVPSGTYTPTGWDGKWFILSNNEGQNVIISMKLSEKVTNDRYEYFIPGILTRTYNDGSLTSYFVNLFTVVNTQKMTAEIDSVKDSELSEYSDYSTLDYYTYGEFGDSLDESELYEGDLFTPLLYTYDGNTDTVTLEYSEDMFVFGEDPKKSLFATEFDKNYCKTLMQTYYEYDDEYTYQII